MTDPATTYKSLLDSAHRAATTHTEHQRTRTIALSGELAATDRTIAAARDEATKVTTEILDWWREARAPATKLPWLTPPPTPTPDPTADPSRLRDYLADIEPATQAFLTALRKATWGRKL